MLKEEKECFVTVQRILKNTEEIIAYLHIQNFDRGLRTAIQVMDEITNFMGFLTEHSELTNKYSQVMDVRQFASICSELLEAQERKDYVLLADLYQLRLIPFLMDIQAMFVQMEDGKVFVDLDIYNKNYEAILKRDKILTTFLRRARAPQRLLENGYGIEYTGCGAYTLYKEANGSIRYYHSNHNPYKEAKELAESWYNSETENYIIYGLGLGYHIFALADLDETIELDVYESDIHIVQLFTAFGDMAKMMENASIHFHYDPDFKLLINKFHNKSNQSTFFIHYPSLNNIKDSARLEQLEDYFLQYSAVKNQIRLLESNFRKNKLLSVKSVDCLYEKWKGKDLYLVSAGPSLDKNYLQLKKMGENGILLAMGTVFRKLMEADIVPDYVILSEANGRIRWQLYGQDTSNTPLLFLSTAYFRTVEEYKGEKYIICQKGFDKAEEYAQHFGYQTYQTGGSVATIALELGIRFSCRRIIFVGQDLAFTNNLRHAENTSLREFTLTKETRMVEDINGNLVPTGKNLDMFRQWMEKRIKNVSTIEFIDATEGGAKIKGTKIKFLNDMIRETNEMSKE